MSNLYRLPLPPPGAEPHVGPYTACPQCGAKAVHCPTCQVVRTDRETFDRCESFNNSGNSQFIHSSYDVLPFDRGTHPVTRVCAPKRRVRFGFLWLQRCQEPGVHIHQKCQRCGWRGVALVVKDAP